MSYYCVLLLVVHLLPCVFGCSQPLSAPARLRDNIELSQPPSADDVEYEHTGMHRNQHTDDDRQSLMQGPYDTDDAGEIYSQEQNQEAKVHLRNPRQAHQDSDRMRKALRRVARYLRHHKYNDYDRRRTNPDTNEVNIRSNFSSYCGNDCRFLIINGIFCVFGRDLLVTSHEV